MRTHQIKALCEGIAQRGPWGTVYRTQDDKGNTVATRVSYAAAIRQVLSDKRNKAYPPAPRADKGQSYMQYPITVIRRGKAVTKLGPRMLCNRTTYHASASV